MTTFPTEILKEIFIHLHQYDKAKCMLVCHHWKNTIEQFSLYHTLYFYSSTYLTELTKKMQNMPKAAKQTERVIFYFRNRDFCYIENINQLLELLPNIKVLFHFGRLYSEYDTFTEIQTPYPWAKQITYLSDANQIAQCLFNDQLSLSSTCANLTTLHINLDASDTIFDDDYFDKFKCVPALTSLKLKNFNANLYQLDILHKYLPHLKSVAFDNIGLIGNQEQSGSKGVVPATLVTDCLFHFNTTHSVEVNVELLTFISKRHPNLTSLSYISHPNSMNANDIQQLNQRGWKPLLRQLGPQLKKLWVNHSANLDTMFDTLDQCGCEINDLKLGFFPWPSINGNQNQYIQKLELSFSERLKLDDFSWLKQLGMLKKFKLERFGNKKIELNLNRFIDSAPPTLKALSLAAVKVSVFMRYSGLATIETLSLTSVKLPANMDTFLSRHFIKLTKLKLCNCNLLGTTFSLPNMDLNYFHYTELFIWDKSSVFVITSRERRLYLIKNDGKNRPRHDDFKSIQHPPFCFPYESRSMDVHKDVPDFTLICQSVRNLNFLIK